MLRLNHRKTWLLLLFVLYGLLLAYGLFRPASPPTPFAGSDKLMHITAFGAFALLAWLSLRHLPAWLLWGGLCLLAPASELLQSRLYSQTRTFSWGDIFANWTGVALAAVLVLGWVHRKRWTAQGQ